MDFHRSFASKLIPSMQMQNNLSDHGQCKRHLAFKARAIPLLRYYPSGQKDSDHTVPPGQSGLGLDPPIAERLMQKMAVKHPEGHRLS